LLSEIVDHDFDEDAGEGVPVVSKWDYENLEQVPIFEPEGVRTNNHTKGTPAQRSAPVRGSRSPTWRTSNRCRSSSRRECAPTTTPRAPRHCRPICWATGARSSSTARPKI